MNTTHFAERIALIRARFAAKLTTKIEETDAVLPTLSGDGRRAVDGVAQVYRRFHDVCGTGPTVGYRHSSRVARTIVDGILAEPFIGKRGLTATEMTKLKEGLDAFRIAARVDMQSAATERSM